MENDAVTIECPCGAVFEVENEEVDGAGDRWTRCPKCNRKLPIPEEDED
ncbi:MAG TPA: hypothetical protein PLP29_00315 [Candidatus Ozemobacteraceae bacterium]|nr:hypothetical protein [Candidatus Ozemobacteraceae bacterium]